MAPTVAGWNNQPCQYKDNGGRHCGRLDLVPPPPLGIAGFKKKKSEFCYVIMYNVYRFYGLGYESLREMKEI